MRQFLLLLFFTSITRLYAQVNFCAFDDVNQQLRSSENYRQSEDAMNKLIANKLSQGIQKTNTVQYIPVVFHVMHLNGPENMSDSIIQSELDKVNAYLSNSAPYYNANAINSNIQLCLASSDPLGNPTTGITRHYTTYTDVSVMSAYNNVGNMKDICRWNPSRYLNVWIVRSVLDYNGAFATLPTSVGNNQDGIVNSYNPLGFGKVLTHEVGHYLGLYHHFEGNSCVNFNCMLDGDKICDTPPEMPASYHCDSSTCSTDLADTSGFNAFTSDTFDVSSVMTGKINCDYIFTPNQSQRMQWMLNQVRYKLLSSSGCTGIADTIQPHAVLQYNFAGCTTGKFYHQSQNYEYVDFDLNNDGIFEFASDTCYRQFTSTDTFVIVMRAFYNGNVDYDTLSLFIHGRPTAIYPLQGSSGITYSHLCSGATATFIAVPGMASYLWSTGDTTQVIHVQSDTAFDISLTCIDTTGYTWTFCPHDHIHIDVVPSPPPATITSLSPDSLCRFDTLQLHVNVPSGSHLTNWIINNFMSYVNLTDQTFYPYTDDYAISVVTISDSNFCKTYSDTVHYYFDPILTNNSLFVWDTVLYAPAGWHNQFYLDGVAIPNATQDTYTVTQPGCYSVSSYHLMPQCETISDTVCFTVTSLQTLRNASSILVYPNPVSDYVVVKGISTTKNVSIVDAVGQVLSLPVITISSSSEMQMNVTSLSSGLYFIRIENQSYRFVKE